MTEQTSIFIIDDDSAIRDSLTLMLQQEGLAVATFDNAFDFLSTIHEECYGCAIIDIRMPGMDGMQLQEELAHRHISLPIIFLTGHGSIPLSVKAIKAGAIDFLPKPVTRDALLHSVQLALEVSQKNLVQKAHSHQARFKLESLTEREREIMHLAVEGLPNKLIARHIGISHRTVEIHRSRIMHKTGAANILELARLLEDSKTLD